MKKIKLFAMAVAAMLAGSAAAAEYSLDCSKAFTLPVDFGSGDVTLKATKNFSVESKQMTSDASYKPYGIKFSSSANSNMDTSFVEIDSWNSPLEAINLCASSTSNGAGKKFAVLYCNVVPFNKDSVIGVETIMSISKDTANDIVRELNIPAGTVSVRMYRKVKYKGVDYGDGSSVYIYNVNITNGEAANYPYVKSFTMGAIKAAVDTAAHTITAELPYGSIRNEEIKNAIIKMGGTAKTYSFNTDTTILTAIDSAEVAKNVDYALNITVNANPSDDATLKSLSVNGTAIKDFSADVLMYDYVVKFTETTMPTLSAEVNEAHAQKVINDVTEIPGAATVVVTAQDGTTQLTYTVNFTRATADKTLYEVVFSNGVKGAIFNVEDDYRIEVPYLAGAGEPTYVSDSVAEGATVEVEGDKLTVTGADATVIEYSIYFIELSAPEFTTDTITFDSTETYIYGHYGWDINKGWKFAKAVNDEGNMRIATGKTRIYMALPACGKVTLISGSGGARAVKVSANGHTPASLTTGKANAGMDIYPSSSEVNFIAIESNQTGGDGGFIKMVMSNEGPATKLSDMKAGEKAEKFILNGKVYFRHNGQVFNALGQEMK